MREGADDIDALSGMPQEYKELSDLNNYVSFNTQALEF